MRASGPSVVGSRASRSALIARARTGRRALGADRDGHGIAVDDGGRDEIAVLQIVDDVDQRALGAGDVGDTGVLGRILGCAVDCYGAARVARFERSAVQGQPPLGRPIHDLGRGSGREDDDLRLGFQEQPELGQRRLAAARQDDAAARDRQEDGEMLHRRGVRGRFGSSLNMEHCSGKRPYGPLDKDFCSEKLAIGLMAWDIPSAAGLPRRSSARSSPASSGLGGSDGRGRHRLAAGVLGRRADRCDRPYNLTDAPATASPPWTTPRSCPPLRRPGPPMTTSSSASR
jgi:hypothetical protein